jgi:3-phenylpropionate/trans-cinnamate dioxygenase ferredoxin reductase subunit
MWNMKKYTYLIIGGGMAADAAVKGIREVDPAGSIGLLAKENNPPYRRPPLSKDLWSGKASVKEIACETEKHGADILVNRTVGSIDPVNRMVTDDVETFHYDRLLLATGGKPRTLPFEDPGIIYFRTLGDYLELLRQQGEKNHFGVIGGGFIGCEITAALSSKGRRVTMVFPEKGIGTAVFPAEVSRGLMDLYHEHGVEIMPGVKVSGLERESETFVLRLESGRTLTVDGLVAGIGIEPETELAQNAGLEVDNGIVVDAVLQTSREDIFAAGDVANFHNPALDKRIRVEHEDNALSMGRTAGRNMAGMHEPYTHLPFFYSDLFDVGYEAIGELDSSLETVGIWKGLREKGIWAYAREGRVRGVLFWNLFGKTDAGRELISSTHSLEEKQLRKRLSTIMEESSDA